ncbi:aminoacyl-tRNA hydrolase [Lactococcus carnosus]|uniref:Peptidyl-tRNA hydrolase n=1 Tax=Pseudolactococcus carnosus TaxID=2749961 RepID=A0ABT0AUF4_9LACT|nr:aminoacyl-tRNA hydrolase [Lactococcus carnosus]MCJ1990345.1 aminoacyl-tRNA hydrolase [Lactococcus carnosus]MCJ2003255.1 aminoacyl-tRNA hydrolase [Lactococcus carnosus]
MVKIIVGLGNPGDKYTHTKHNIGFDVLDVLADRLDISFKRDKTFISDIASTFVDGEKVLLVKPLTFMNDSGKAVKPILSYNGLTADDLMVVYDDLDMAVGKLRLRQKGSAGGHNGIKSISEQLNTQVFNRIKVGIGRPKHGMSVVNHVLGRFDKTDNEDAEIGIARAADAVQYFIETNNFNQTGNQFNG